MSKKPNRVVQYKIANERFFQEKSQEEDIKTLESGILMRQIKTGYGDKCPTLNSLVYVNYTGKLMDGTIFDTTDTIGIPACFKVRDLIVGWQAALIRMHVGDIYEIFIPAKYGYGSAKMDGIPAHSTLIFTLELLKIL